MKVTGNVKYIPAGTTQYIVDGNDGQINVDTSVSAVTIVLPNIINSGYANTDKGFIINDISNNAATNNITIVASNNTTNSQSSVSISVNGGTAKCSIASLNEWFVITEPTTSGMSGNLTANYIPKATASDTIGDSSITDDGTTVTVNGGFYATTGASEILIFGDTANITADGQTNTNIETNLTENILRHNLKNTFDAPANNFPQLTASQSVETDASKNLVSVAHYTESFAYTGSPFTLTVAPNYIFSIRTTSMVLDESDINDVTIVGTTLTVINPAFQSGETLYIKYKG